MFFTDPTHPSWPAVTESLDRTIIVWNLSALCSTVGLELVFSPVDGARAEGGWFAEKDRLALIVDPSIPTAELRRLAWRALTQITKAARLASLLRCTRRECRPTEPPLETCRGGGLGSVLANIYAVSKN